MIGDIHSRGRKRTSVPVKKTIKEVDIVALRFEDMVIRTKEGVACHLNRFRYTGCPTIRTIVNNWRTNHHYAGKFKKFTRLFQVP